MAQIEMHQNVPAYLYSQPAQHTQVQPDTATAEQTENKTFKTHACQKKARITQRALKLRFKLQNRGLQSRTMHLVCTSCNSHCQCIKLYPLKIQLQKDRVDKRQL